jgi:hypothetical protein
MTAYERLCDRLTERGLIAHVNGVRASARCPAHEDRDPSLSITAIEGSALVYCHGPCETVDVLAALELGMADLFDTPRGADYRYDNGRTVHRSPDKQFRQANTDRPPELYRLGRVRAAVAERRPVFVVEGEKDVHAVETLGLTATCSPMGASNAHKCDWTPLAAAQVVIVADRDEAGAKHAADVLAILRALDPPALAAAIVHAADGCKDAADHVAAGHGVAEFVRVDTGALLPPAARPDIPARLDWHALWADQEPDEFILEPILPARRAVTIYSAPKVGKSLLMLELAVAISRGERVLGNLPDRAHRVLYVDFENDPRGDVRGRLEAMGYGPDDLDQLCYLSFPVMAALDSPAGGDELLATAAHYGCDLIVLDTISRSVAGEENENTTWLGFYRHTGLRLKQAGIALVRLDHSGKDTTKGQRGGSAKSGDVDAVWHLTEVASGTLRLDLEASRLLIAEKTITIHRDTEPRLTHRVDPRAQAAAFDAQLAEVIHRLDDLGVPRDIGRDAAREALREAGFKIRTASLGEAVKRRKATVPNSRGQALELDLSPAPGDSEGTDTT